MATARPVPAALIVLPVSSTYATLLAGIVQNTSFVPAVKSTAASLFELEITVSLANVPAPTVPIPTSNCAPFCV